MASEAPEPDTFEWTARSAAAHLQQADISLDQVHSLHHELTTERQAKAVVSIAHSLFALATMMHYVFVAEEGDDGHHPMVGDDER